MATFEQLAALPVYNRVTVGPEHLDLMGHMNVRHYLGIFDDGSWQFFQALGMTPDYYRENQAGGFALRQVITYLAEVRSGETVTIHSRLLARAERKMHVMHFMLNETTRTLAATLEVLGAHADMRIRRTSPYPEHLAAALDAMIAAHRQLDWDVELSGAIRL